jgi:hypothetical protein
MPMQGNCTHTHYLQKRSFGQATYGCQLFHHDMEFSWLQEVPFWITMGMETPNQAIQSLQLEAAKASSLPHRSIVSGLDALWCSMIMENASFDSDLWRIC